MASWRSSLPNISAGENASTQCYCLHRIVCRKRTSTTRSMAERLGKMSVVKWLEKWKSPWPFRPFRTPPALPTSRPPLHTPCCAPQKPPPCKVTGTGHWLLQARASVLLGRRESGPRQRNQHRPHSPLPWPRKSPLFLGPASAPAPRLGPCLNNFGSQCPVPVSPSLAPSFCDSTISIPYLRVAIPLHLRTS